MEVLISEGCIEMIGYIGLSFVNRPGPLASLTSRLLCVCRQHRRDVLTLLHLECAHMTFSIQSKKLQVLFHPLQSRELVAKGALALLA